MPFCWFSLGVRERFHLKGELSFALGLPPNDERQQEAHSEDQAEGCDVPHRSASLHGQYTERQDEGSCRKDPWFVFARITRFSHDLMLNYSAPAEMLRSGSLAPTHQRGTDVDGETRQRGWLGVVGEHQTLEAEPLLHTRQEAYTGDANLIALLRLLCVGSLIGLAEIFRLVPVVLK